MEKAGVTAVQPANVPTLHLTDDLSIPCIGFGTYKLVAAEVESALDAAFESGYRHFDCAYLYQNEEFIGQKLQKWFAEDNVKRTDLFLWNTFHRRDLVRVGCKRSLEHLKLDYLDLYLVHWPVAYQPSDEISPLNADGSVKLDNTDLLETWRAMEDLVNEGLCRAIGVSNFNRRQLKRILDNCTIKPAMLQVESHTHFPNVELIDFARSNGILVTAYCPLGGPYRPTSSGCRLIDEPVVCKIAEKYKKTPGQILLRHGIQRGIVVIPKSKTPSRIAENINIFDFELTANEMEELRKLGNHERLVRGDPMRRHPEFPFVVDSLQ
ncbi:hypothetical protein AAHC03_0546 [Spirometra sp. Aus1]